MRTRMRIRMRMRMRKVRARMGKRSPAATSATKGIENSKFE